ncbi:MAG TPA: hypothetical protein VL086_18275 [Candidatus Nitrosotalea sp.]|jgi:hypothetical protein|nr:hypothetical protein [Candidatus Nitrosotalea sp.]
MSASEAAIKQAVTWINEQTHGHPKASRTNLIDEASRRFDLTPLHVVLSGAPGRA